MLNEANILMLKIRFLATLGMTKPTSVIASPVLNTGRSNPARIISLIFFIALIILLCSVGLSSAADIKVSPSATRVSPGENFYIDIVVENIPSEGLGAIQFRLNLDAQGSTVTGVPDISQGGIGDVSVSTPLIIGPPTSNRSGIGEFFYNAIGPNGILVMDNENLNAGSALYTFGHTSGSIPSSGSGSVARFHFAVGKDVAAEKIIIDLSDVMLLDAGTVYPLDSNTGAIIELRCMTEVPNLLGLSQYDAEATLANSKLSVGNIYEMDNWDGRYALNKVLVQSHTAGASVLCETPVDLAINTPPSEISSPNAIDKTNDENGTVILSWIPSASSDTLGYRIYLSSNTDSLLKEIRSPASAETEITGLPSGQSSRIKITAFDNFGNENQGVIISVQPIDDMAPRITIEGVADGAYYSSDILPIITVEDANLSTKEITLNGAQYNMAAISLEGNYILRVIASDTSGNSATREISFVIDKTPPVISVFGIEKGRYYNTNLSPIITVSDPNLQSVNSFLNESPFTSGSLITAEGAYDLRIEAADKAGNRSSDTYIFYIDKTKPSSIISIGEPKFEKDGTFVSGSTPFTLTGKDEGIIVSGLDRLEYRINNGTWNAYQTSFTLSGINDGTVTVDYRAHDRAGNTEDLHTVTVKSDNTPPETTLLIGEPKYINNTGVTYGTKDTPFNLSAADTLSGVSKTEYRIDSGEWISYVPFKISTEGSHTISYRSMDNLGNLETDKVLPVIIDNTPPVTDLSTGIPKYTSSSGDIYATKDTVFTLSASDNLSGVAKTEYRVDGGAWTIYVPFGIAAEGNHIIEYRSQDNVANVEDIKLLRIIIDNAPPVTEITVGEPKFSSADQNLYVTGNTTFTLTATDNLSGVAKTEYRIDSSEWLTYVQFKLTSEGSHTIGYRSIDNLGNTETEKTLAIIVDNTPPESTITIGMPQYQADGNLYINGNTEISITAKDSGSGLKKTEYGMDGSSFTVYTGTITLASYSEGSHSISYRSMDNIGNTEDTKSLTIILDKTPPQTTISASDPLTDGVTNTVSPGTRFTLNSTDKLSGVKELKYKIDGGSWQVYTASFSLSSAGEHTIAYKATDNVLNEETEKAIIVRLISLSVEKTISTEPEVLISVWTDNSDTEQKQADINNLISILSSLNISYHIPSSLDEFTEALRSGRYNTCLLIDFKDSLIGEEIREAVNSGDGLVFIKTSPDADPFFDDLFGVKFTGKTTGSDLTVRLIQSPISDEGTLRSTGKNVVATVNSDTAQILGYVVDKHDTYPSIVSNQYGKGKTVLYNFDLLYSGDQTKATDLILNSLNYIKPQEPSITALSSLPVRIKITNSTEPVDLRITETLPNNTGADSVFPETTQTETTITWQKSLSADETAVFSYYLELPDLKGDYSLNTEVKYNNYGDYRLYGNYSFTVSITNNSTELLQAAVTELSGIAPPTLDDAEKIGEAIEILSQINTNASTRKDAEQNIKAIINAIDKIRGLSFDASEIRSKLDELLKVWEMKWYMMG